MRRPLPQTYAFLICDQAFQMLPTGKWCIIGTFDAILVADLPVRFPPFQVFLSLGEFMGNATVEVVMRDDQGDVVYAVRGQVPPIPDSSPLSNFELAMPFPNVEFKREGSHSLELSVDGALISVRSLRVHKGTPPPPGGTE
jgi:hypothetical protein